ncbi:MAG: RNA polymerase sigma factor [Chitinophagaceae bacterium]|nr:RNA polymerase sigma factor [Chitinophagaceae bacterium]MBK8951952.1 RNA polymerase sigma factor [Chitinophagaceae bacterium]
MQDVELIQSILDGNQRDYELLVKKYQTNVFRTAIGMLHNKEDAEEITQDVFIKVFHSLSSFSGKSAFSTWLYRIAINTSISYLRKKKRKGVWIELTDFFHIQSKEKHTELVLTEKNDKILIQQAIDSLSDKQKLAFILTKHEELPQRQVAEIMEISEGAVEQLVVRAKTNLRKKLEAVIRTP